MFGCGVVLTNVMRKIGTVLSGDSQVAAKDFVNEVEDLSLIHI